VKRKVVVGLLTDEQEFQLMQAADARAAGERTGLEVEVVFAGNNAIQQIHQLYSFVHAPEEQRPVAIVVEAVSRDGMQRLARNATKAGIAWVQQWRAEYLAALRAENPEVPVASISVDENEVGRVQALQLRALLPERGEALLVQGPVDSETASRRLDGFQKGMEGSAVRLRQVLNGDWTAKSAEAALASFLRLKTTDGFRLDAVVCQNDSMASGALDALRATRNDWAKLVLIGCDGLPHGGKRMVEEGRLAATVIKPWPTGAAIDLVARTRRGEPAPLDTILGVTSHPPLEDLARRRPR